MSESGEPFTRVNGEMLHSFRGRNISLLGKLNNEAGDGMSFEVTSSDNKTILCKLKVPIRENLSEFVEVYGNVDEKGNINCINYATFDQSLTKNFDLELYNETLEMCSQLPKHYSQQLA